MLTVHRTASLLAVALFGVAPAVCFAADDAALEVVAEGLDFPANMAVLGEGSGHVFVLEHHSGKIRVVQDGELLPEAFLDIGDRLTETPNGEEGLLGLAFPPDFPTKRHVYVTYTGKNNDLVLSRFLVTEDRSEAIESSEEVILSVDRGWNDEHHCGHIEFGPLDGFLYMCIGDMKRSEAAQALDELQGKILRLDVEDSQSPYAIPDDNPFLNDANARPEIWALGLRNPWKFSFDPLTGDLFIPDVGHHSWEEINLLERGGDSANFGWPVAEGNDCVEWKCDTGGFRWPLFEYPHDELVCSVIGGAVYRGERTPDWDGVYVFGDHCRGDVWALRHVVGERPSVRKLLPTGSVNPTAIGTDHEGEILIADVAGELYRLRLPEDAAAGWQPVEELLREQAMWARRTGTLAPVRTLQEIKAGRRWTWTQWLVDLYSAMGRPIN